MENVVKVVNGIINWLWNRENVTLLIAIAGFGMSLYNFFGRCGISDARSGLTM